jgi:hypothetical protein
MAFPTNASERQIIINGEFIDEEEAAQAGLICGQCGHWPHKGKLCNGIHTCGPLYGHFCSCYAHR